MHTITEIHTEIPTQKYGHINTDTEIQTQKYRHRNPGT